jgi:thiamine biosynthesis lipoprotein
VESARASSPTRCSRGCASAASALVAAAGDLAFYGGTRGRPWTVAIEDPDHPGGLLAEMPLREGGVSTSAPTYRYFEAEGRRFHHLLDPRTGYPAAEVRSVTVVAPLATQSDGFSTAIFVLGRDGEALLARHPEVSALILFEDGTRFLSPELPVRWLRSTVDGG